MKYKPNNKMRTFAVKDDTFKIYKSVKPPYGMTDDELFRMIAKKVDLKKIVGKL